MQLQPPEQSANQNPPALLQALGASPEPGPRRRLSRVAGLAGFSLFNNPETLEWASLVASQWDSLAAQLVKNPPEMRETWVKSPGWKDPLEKGKPTHSSILA